MSDNDNRILIEKLAKLEEASRHFKELLAELRQEAKTFSIELHKKTEEINSTFHLAESTRLALEKTITEYEKRHEDVCNTIAEMKDQISELQDEEEEQEDKRKERLHKWQIFVASLLIALAFAKELGLLNWFFS
jgi:chromosome segregation ATPase